MKFNFSSQINNFNFSTEILLEFLLNLFSKLQKKTDIFSVLQRAKGLHTRNLLNNQKEKGKNNSQLLEERIRISSDVRCKTKDFEFSVAAQLRKFINGLRAPL